MDYLRYGKTVTTGGNRAYRVSGGYWGLNTLISLVKLGLAKRMHPRGFVYRATTEAEQSDWDQLPYHMKEGNEP